MKHIKSYPLLNEKASVLWHGSPHKFDMFTTDAIGTGEGNQFFGWGLYFTDLKDIALEYAHGLYGNKEKIDWMRQYKELMVKYPLLKHISHYALTRLRQSCSTPKMRDYCIKELASFLPSSNKFIEDEEGNHVREVDHSRDVATQVVDEMAGAHDFKPNLYKININLDKCRWFEWYNPVSVAVATLVKEAGTAQGIDIPLTIGEDYVKFRYGGVNGNIASMGNHKELYEVLQDYMPDKTQKEVSMLLLKAGFNGVKYPVGTVGQKTEPRTNEAAHYNYVLFEHGIIKKIAHQVAK